MGEILGLIKGESLLLAPNEITKENLEFVAGELLYEIINLDMKNNAANKMYVVSDIVKDIMYKSNVSVPTIIYIGDYTDSYDIYKKAQDIKHSLKVIISSCEKQDDMDITFDWLCKHWAHILVTINQDVCKETTSMILDVREGKNFYFINKK